MRIVFLSVVLAACAIGPAMARPKLVPLPEASAASLAGKSLAVTRRGVKPSFMAMTAGKAGFALLGAGMMAAEGNRMVNENNIPDPADTVESALVPAIVKQFGVRLTPESGHSITPGNEIKQIVGASPGTELVLDIRSIGWNFAYYPAHWGTYWVGYGVEVQLIDAKSGQVLADAPCSSNTHDSKAAPSKEALTGNGARLLKDVLSSLAWNCTHLLATEEFHIASGNVAETPAALVDPLAAFAAPATAAPAADAPVTTPAVAPPATQPEQPVAPPAPKDPADGAAAAPPAPQ